MIIITQKKSSRDKVMIVIRWDAPYLLNDDKNFMESSWIYGGFCFIRKKFWGENVQIFCPIKFFKARENNKKDCWVISWLKFLSESS